MTNGYENRPGQLVLLDYGLSTPERPLGDMAWPEFSASVEDDDLRTLSSLCTILGRLSRGPNAFRRGIWDGLMPIYEEMIAQSEERPVLLSKPNESSSRSEARVDLDQLYILTRTEEFDKVPGVGRKMVDFVVNLLNEHIEQQSQSSEN